MITERLKRPIDSSWKESEVLQRILNYQKSKEALSREVSSLYAYLYSKTKNYETERFSYLWMAMNQLQRTSEMEYIIESTKTNAGTRKIPMTEEVFRCFQAILEDREPPAFEQMVDGHVGFLYLDDQGLPLVAMHWEHRFNRMVRRYNEIFRVQMPNITPHICRHTYCSNQAKAGMNPKTLQYLMGHSDIGVTMNVYTHLGLEDAAEEMARMEEVE